MAKVLFVCSANQDRSVTAQDYFRYTMPQHTYKSAGINQKEIEKAGKGNYLTQEDLHEADVVYVMTKTHKELIETFLFDAQEQELLDELKEKICVLGIDNDHAYGATELVLMLDDRLGSALSYDSPASIIQASREEVFGALE